jgi:hypothetical protein
MFGTKIVHAYITVLALVATCLAQGQKPSLEQLSWLRGCWEGRQGEATLEEIWLKPLGLSMLGRSRAVKNGKTVSYEFMQFRQNNEGLAFIAQPRGGPAVSFKFARSGDDEVVFENPQHDFPQRITYQRKGKGLLLASIEGTEKGKNQRTEFQMRRVRCDADPEKP